MAERLNIVGCGRVGKTLARLWASADMFHVGAVLNRSLESAEAAVDLVGSGYPVASYVDMGKARAWMIAVSDDALQEVAQCLHHSGQIDAETVVFHCSGAISSAVFSSLREQGAAVGSAHPLKSFADPTVSVASFSGTYCGIEGDRAAVALLRSAIEAIQGIAFEIDGAKKIIYHAGAVLVSNCLVALLEAGVRCYEESGVGRDAALRLMAPFVHGTLNNVTRLGTVKALTGPIARGEDRLVARQYEALKGWQPEIGDVYATLGRLAVQLSEAQGGATRESLERVRLLLSKAEK
jgi:predicted short-subunit dehydrogenase-like oxidoreductase (DUF2520 family)